MPRPKTDLKLKIDHFMNVTFRQLPIFYRRYVKTAGKEKPSVIGIIRERNEALILKDTLDHIAQFVDGVIVFDDASTDNSVEVALSHHLVLEVIVNKKWRRHNRIWEETANRKKLLERARKYAPDWLFYFDADERFEGDIRNFLINECPKEVNAVRISLFDAYITEKDKRPYQSNDQLLDFRRYFGPEKRDIMMIWRNVPKADFVRPDTREPQGFTEGEKLTKFYCQHYGKAQSIKHWEETCRYYADFFPKYRRKWLARMGKAIHRESDFGMRLYPWEEAKKHAVSLESIQNEK